MTNIYQLLKTNAPKLWKKFYFKRKTKLEKRLNELRQEWRQADEEDRKRIEAEANEIKSLLSELCSIDQS